MIQAFYIPSESMVPTLEVGDRVFVSKFMFDGGDVARGDVIVFENPNAAELPDRSGISSVLHWLGEGVGLAQPENEDFIKRVIALARARRSRSATTSSTSTGNRSTSRT